MGLKALGDATCAMTGMLRMTARGLLNHVAREITLRKATEGWRYRVGHILSEANTVADTLSRLNWPTTPALPQSCCTALRRAPPDWDSGWRVLLWKAPPEDMCGDS